MSQQTDIAVRRLIEMTKAGEIEWVRFEDRFYIADVEIGENTYAIKVGDFIIDFYLWVNDGKISEAKQGSPEHELWSLADQSYCKHAEFLYDLGVTDTVEDATTCP